MIEKLTFSEWMRRYRPDGKGYIGIYFPAEPTDIIAFTEVICDFCNAQIEPEQEDGTETVIGVLDESDALCADCTVRAERNRTKGEVHEQAE